MRAKLIFISMVLSLPLVALFSFKIENNSKQDELILYCAAGLRLPIQKIVNDFENDNGVRVKIQFGGSGSLLANIEAVNRGDLYLAADSSYTEIGFTKGLINQSIPICELNAGLIVKKGNPFNIKTIEDCINDDSVRLVLANPEAASIGKFTKNVLLQSQLWDKVARKVTVMKPTVNDVANTIKIDAADVGIAWDVISHQYDALDFVELKEFNDKSKTVTLGLLDSSLNKKISMDFANYMISIDKGQKTLKDFGYKLIDEKG